MSKKKKQQKEPLKFVRLSEIKELIRRLEEDIKGREMGAKASRKVIGKCSADFILEEAQGICLDAAEVDNLRCFVSDLNAISASACSKDELIEQDAFPGTSA